MRGISISTLVDILSCIMDLTSDTKAIGSSFFNSRLNKSITNWTTSSSECEPYNSFNFIKASKEFENGKNMATQLFIYWCCNQGIVVFPNGKLLIWSGLWRFIISLSFTNPFPQLIENGGVFYLLGPLRIALFSCENYSHYGDEWMQHKIWCGLKLIWKKNDMCLKIFN